MKKIYLQWGLPVVLLAICSPVRAQNVGLGTTTPHPSAQLDISSTVRGLLIPRMNTGGILAIPNPAKGLLVYDSVRNQFMVNMGNPAAPDWENIAGKNGGGGDSSGGWGARGNSNTSDSDFIGTTNQADLNFRVNNIPAGKLDSAAQNTFYGVGAGTDAPGRLNNKNTAVGFHALGNTTTGADNTAVGMTALQANSDGTRNVAIGEGALLNIQHGMSNTAIGSFAMSDSKTGDFNVAVGLGALDLNSGIRNIGIGVNSMTSNSGNDNVAIGTSTFESNTGTGNTVVGNLSLAFTQNSSFNTVVGYLSGSQTHMGYNNVILGANNDITPGFDNLFNVILIGQDVHVAESNAVRIGNIATKTIGGFQNWTNFSDGRYKRNMKENVKGIDFIMRLRPITYNLDVSSIQHKMTGGKSPAMHPSMAKSLQETAQTTFSGFSAQEVEQAAQASGYQFSGVDKPSSENGFYGLRYSDFVVPLVKAVQEQQRLIEALEKRIATLERQLPTKN